MIWVFAICAVVLAAVVLWDVLRYDEGRAASRALRDAGEWPKRERLP